MATIRRHAKEYTLNTAADGRWHLVVGDPTLLGWLTFVGYMLASLACWRAWQVCCVRLAATALAGHQQRRLSSWWLGLGALMLLLGLNKQLDLQTLLTELGKDLALAQGWYDDRRRVQRVFVVALALLLGGAGLAVTVALRQVLRQVMPALLGLSLILAYVAVRAAMFHLLRAPPGIDPLPGLELLELGGVGLVGWSALRAARIGGRAG